VSAEWEKGGQFYTLRCVLRTLVAMLKVDIINNLPSIGYE